MGPARKEHLHPRLPGDRAGLTPIDHSAPTPSHATIAGLRFRYLDWGGDGSPVLALHGLASSAHWYDIVAPLLRDRFRIIAPDQRGHGQSAQAGSGYDWPTLASDAIGLLDHLGLGTAAVVGHSWGANVALNTAALHPDRVAALVMVDGGFFGRNLRGGTTWEEFRTRLSPRDVSGTRAELLERMPVLGIVGRRVRRLRRDCHLAGVLIAWRFGEFVNSRHDYAHGFCQETV